MTSATLLSMLCQAFLTASCGFLISEIYRRTYELIKSDLVNGEDTIHKVESSEKNDLL